MAVTSPYFKSRKRSSPSQNFSTGTKKSRQSSKSCYFNQSPLSCFGSINRLGPLIFTLSEKPRPKGTCVRNDNCGCCISIVNDVLSKFYECDQFRSQWECQPIEELSGQKTLTCWEKADLTLQSCARHLCQHRCYMRAFAPVREWIALREQVHEETELPLDLLFEGWSCKLSAVEIDSVVMTSKDGPPQVTVVFGSPDGTNYSNKTEAAKAILAQNLAVKATQTAPESHSPSPDLVSSNTTAIIGELPALSIRNIPTPLGLLEELFCDDPWRLLLSTILLNRTSRVQVDTVLDRFLQKWPTARDASQANPDELCGVIRPLGMTNKRCAGIIRFSREFLALLESKLSSTTQHPHHSKTSVAFDLSQTEIQSLFYCGEYAAAAYEIFIRRNFWKKNHQDHALTWYVEYQRGKRREVETNGCN